MNWRQWPWVHIACFFFAAYRWIAAAIGDRYNEASYYLLLTLVFTGLIVYSVERKVKAR
jgi:hypothetical protein